MNNLYVFAIGGTGARVLYSLTMLLASGVKIQAKKVIPIIIDTDDSCGNTTRLITLLRNYQSIYGSLSHIGKINAFDTEIGEMGFPSPYYMPLCPNSKVEFKNGIGLASMSAENQALMHMLYSDGNLDLNMKMGFQGNPNMGSVILNQFKNCTEFETFAKNFHDDDGIFIISSIFGGTGASGFPLLVKNLRSAAGVPNAHALQQSKIGAITVMPYFDLDKGKEIDSDTFIQKTKAALAYYEKNLSGEQTIGGQKVKDLQIHYYIGDGYRQPQPNNPGNAAQTNASHFVEFASALAIIDYAEEWQNLPLGSCDYKEFAVESDGSEAITLPYLSDSTREIIGKPLMEMTLAAKFIRDHFTSQDAKTQDWYQTYAKNARNNSFRNFTKDFLNWLEEMANKDRGTTFCPFTLDNKPNAVYEFVNGYKTKGMGYRYATKYNWDLADAVLNDTSRNDIAQSSKDADGQLVSIIMIAMQRLIEGKIKY